MNRFRKKLRMLWRRLYAVIAHSISQRTQEIGVRMALGGTRQDILRLVVAQGMAPMLLGMALGLPAAFAVTQVLRMALIGVSPGDPMAFLIGCTGACRRGRTGRRDPGAPGDTGRPDCGVAL